MLRSFIFVMCLVAVVFAQVPKTINYQGKLTNMSGVGENDTLDMIFRIFDVETGGTALWEEPHADPTNVPIVHGLFDVNLGVITPIDLSFDEQYWLEIVVDGNLLAPRVQLTTSPYAFRAAVADSFTGGVSPWTQDTMVAHWDSIRGIPGDIADGDDIAFQKIRANYSTWLTDSVTLVEGTNITLTQTGDTIVIEADGVDGLWQDTTGYIHNINAATPDNRIWVEEDGDLRVNQGGIAVGVWADTFTTEHSILVSPYAEIANWTGTVAIPDYNCPSGGCGADSYTEVTATATGILDLINSVRIQVTINHTYVNDLNIWLVSPEGTPVCLSHYNGGSGDNYTATIFDDAAALSITEGSAPFTGSYRPESPLSVLVGENPNGTWRLRVCDAWESDFGDILEFHVFSGGESTWTEIDSVLPALREPGQRNICVSGNGIFGGTVSGADAVEDNDFVTKRQITTGTTSLWTQTGTNIYNSNSGNVGIGTSTPSSELSFSNEFGDNFDEWSDYKILLYTGPTPEESYGLGVKMNTLAFNTNRDFDFDINGVTAMTVQSGNVGIGTASPAEPLQVEHTVGTHSAAASPTIKAEVTNGTYTMTAILAGEAGYQGVYGETDVPSGVGVRGIATGGDCMGIHGAASGSGSVCYGVFGYATGAPTNYGVLCSGNGGYTGSWTDVSDRKFKKNIAPMTGILAKVLELNPVTYEMRTQEYSFMGFSEGTEYGLIAQELNDVFPELVHHGVYPGEQDGSRDPVEYEGIDYISLTSILVRAVQEQQVQIEGFETENDELRARIERLERLIETK